MEYEWLPRGFFASHVVHDQPQAMDGVTSPFRLRSAPYKLELDQAFRKRRSRTHLSLREVEENNQRM